MQQRHRVSLSPSFNPVSLCIYCFGIDRASLSRPPLQRLLLDHCIRRHTQLQNKGEQGDVTYAEAVPWLEVASFGGFLSTLEVMIATLLALRVFHGVVWSILCAFLRY